MTRITESALEEINLQWVGDMRNAARDALLPKLLSGEMRIPDVNRFAEGCALWPSPNSMLEN
jgi:hypothetical protein